MAGGDFISEVAISDFNGLADDLAVRLMVAIEDYSTSTLNGKSIMQNHRAKVRSSHIFTSTFAAA